MLASPQNDIWTNEHEPNRNKNNNNNYNKIHSDLLIVSESLNNAKQHKLLAVR